MDWNQVYVAMGGNIGNTAQVFTLVLEEISNMEGVRNLRVSKFYQTKPVSSIPQPDYLNGVCTFETNLSCEELFQRLEQIEKKYGKRTKRKEEPRIIDLDLLFYGGLSINTQSLTVPHPKWKERLFVLLPLSDLTSYVDVEGKRWEINQLIKEQL